jgi:hypothetical protein
MAVHTFDPSASPAEKAAIAGKARDQVKSVNDQGPADAGARGESIGRRSRVFTLLSALAGNRGCARYWTLHGYPYYHCVGCGRDLEGGTCSSTP